MKRVTIAGAMVAALTFGATGGEVTATGVTAQQRYPWNGMVDITVTLSGASNDAAQAECRFVATNSATHAALNVSHVTGDIVASGSGSTWTRRFLWDATADIGEVKIADLELVVEATKSLGGVQLWANGPYWAECNVGATKPEEYGYYFWWGDTVGYKRNAANDGWVSVKDGSSFSFSGDTWFSGGTCPTDQKSNSELQSAGYIDSSGNLVAAHDAATAHLGAPWRMPTDAEFSALIDNCTTTWEMFNGVCGLRVTGKGVYSSKSIFLPAAGYGYDSSLHYLGSLGLYWSSTPRSGNSYLAWCLRFDSNDEFYRDLSDRGRGPSVRPLRGFAK